ncbi:prepilin-type N-terminal cleavage/methylation domain-containing protein [bacterium]|nr:prepilin-type N-terminal cleavage/methylation domain-containing protein [bacterium]
MLNFKNKVVPTPPLQNYLKYISLWKNNIKGFPPLDRGGQEGCRYNDGCKINPLPSPLPRRGNVLGFTLAEVLITLVIIGVIAALTVPTLIHKHRAEEFESRFKKAVSVINAIPNYFKLDNAEELTCENYNDKNFANLLKKHLQVMRVEDGAVIFNQATPKYRNFSNTADLTTSGGWFDNGNIVLNDGMTFFIDNDNGLFITVDINGYKKKPNRFGYDLFCFSLAHKIGKYDEITQKGNGKAYPMGHPYTGYTNPVSCSKSGDSEKNGLTCAYEASKNPNYFKELMY